MTQGEKITVENGVLMYQITQLFLLLKEMELVRIFGQLQACIRCCC